MKKKVEPVVDEAIETLNMKDGPSRRRLIEGAGLFSATAAASALIAACTSSSSSSASSSSTASATGSALSSNPFPKTPSWQFWFVNHADTNEFFTPTKYGYSDAAALLGLPTPQWGGDPNSNEANMISFMNSAVSAKAAGIALAQISNTAFTGAVSNAMSAGIPVLTYNADGIYKNGVAEIGSNRLAYVGQALYLSGQAMGEQIKTLIPGGGHIAIFIATPGTGNIQPRYDGAVSVLGSSYQVDEVGTTTVDATELSTEKAYMLGHKSTLKGAFAVDSGSTANLTAALAGAGLSIPAGGFDTDPRTLAGLSSGKIKFSIFQDPYLQGFLPVVYLYLYNLSGAQLAPPDTDTGLTVLTPSNVSQFLKNSRFQGGASAQQLLPRPSGAISQPPATTST
ncbi:MAG TPA: substrate-binding domain-containing protein [Streptosporangiaceae bacterium]|jgi:simple sugar transport system substrate-binding protein|nr:substrate-binding domain-containing protein [Streptosporangiaceae bacterium]